MKEAAGAAAGYGAGIRIFARGIASAGVASDARAAVARGQTRGRAVFEPGWRWSNDVKPIAGTDLCQAPHFLYQISGRMRVKMADGTEMESGPGDAAIIPPGHDAWVVGSEPVVVVDWVARPTTRSSRLPGE